MTQLFHLDDMTQPVAWQNQVAGGAVSVGNFDGVHRGHRQLLSEVRRLADRLGGPAVVTVLDPHPAVVLRPHSAPPRLTTVERRAELMSDLGIDFLVVCRTSIEFLNHTAEDFYYQLLQSRLGARAIVEGPNFFFGRDRGGDINKLRSLCEAAQIDLQIVQPQVDQDRLISSSRIREAIAAGDLGNANGMLGSSYRLEGTVVAGERRGRTLGFPTANLDNILTLLPCHGVYAGMVRVGNESRGHETWAAAIHIGPNPTFDDRQVAKVEVHLLDYDGDLYGKSLSVDLVAQVRQVQRFKDAEQLIAQLKDDVKTVRQLTDIANPLQ